MRRLLRETSLFALIVSGALVSGMAFAPTAFAQQSAKQKAATSQAPAPVKKDKLLVEANELVFDKDKDTVSAKGNAQLYYQGKVLEADRVIYDRKTKHVVAEGNARMTDTNGTKYYGDRFELTDDFKNGFIDSLRTQSPDKQRFAAARGERSNGEVSVFERGTYTACEPCKDHPEKPPLWQVRAARIIHNASEQTIYYENATLEFWGVPVAYMPFFSSADPTVTRKSGFLVPHYIAKKSLGRGVSLPYFWALGPNYDVTMTPTFLSRQGVLGEIEWRHRLNTGSYNIRAAGIFQRDSEAFVPSPLGAGNKTQRGSVESTGLFYINEQWKWGWDLAVSSDKYFFSNYRVRSESLASHYQGSRESISTLFLNGQGDNSWFDIRGYHFRPLVSSDWQKQQPIVHPVWDYDKRIYNSPLGGELQLLGNFTSLTREAADYSALPTLSTVGNAVSPALFSGWTPLNSKGKTYAYSLYQGCVTYQPGSCILRGMAGNYTRGTLAVSWRRTFIDPLGQTWTPFAQVRGDVAYTSLDTTSYAPSPLDMAVYGNDKQRFFLSDDTNFVGRIMPAVGVTYRFPFIATTDWGSHQLSPIAQIVARPNEGNIGKLPNEDAQSLVFDDSNLFTMNKFSGFDRIEGGMRGNYGLEYTFTNNNGGYVNMLFGQSVHMSGRNSFAKADTVNTGLDSGLDSRRSDYVGRFVFSPVSNFTIIARGRMDEASFALRRMDVTANANFGLLTLGTSYSRIAPQPLQGYNLRREGISQYARLQLPNKWYVSGSVLFDMDRYLSDRAYHLAYPTTYPRYNNSPFRIASTGFTVGYKDECVDFSFAWSRNINDVVTGTKSTGNTYMFHLELKNLGTANYRMTNGTATVTEPGSIQ